ncbi:MAG TPA: hypothetical protein VJY39_01170 [Acidisphaera sp.]|nr:hypothetical protein [Acidisphaera sp.]
MSAALKAPADSQARSACVIGAGVAGLTAAHLLRARGWNVAASGTPRASFGAILLRETTARLLLAIWGDTDGTLLRGARRLHGRRVLWGTEPEARVAQPAYAIELSMLVAALAERVGRLAPDSADACAWTLAATDDAASPLGPARRHGVRRAWIADVALSPLAPRDEAVLEGVDGGWFMLLPDGSGRGTLQAVAARASDAPPFDDLRARTRLMRDLVGEVCAQAGPFPCMPRLRAPAAGSRTIAVGEAALACDPLCGDGVGHALRGAVAAASALQAIAAGAPEAEALRRYDAGLAFAMRRHLGACIAHYEAAGGGWDAEIAAMCDAAG